VTVTGVLVAGSRFGSVLADTAFGMSAGFHRGLSERWLFWAVDILHTQKVHTTAVRLRRSRAAPPSTPSARR
jgi:hypothetical protein